MKNPAQDLQKLQEKVGERRGPSEWLLVDQARVNAFADATGDHQWIHVDPLRAKDGLIIVAVANRRLFSYFRQRRGTMFAIGGILYHQIYYLYSAATFAYCLAAYGWASLRRRFKGRADAG